MVLVKKKKVIVDLDNRKVRTNLIEREHKKLSKKGIAHIYKGKIHYE